VIKKVLHDYQANPTAALGYRQENADMVIQER
jgi:hypothetical protein